MSLKISNTVSIPDDEIQLNAVRAQGAGGQNVNKVSTAIHLRFDITASSLPQVYKERLLQMRDRRISRDGVVVIKAQRFRSQDKNREDALQRLCSLLQSGGVTRRTRVATRPTRASKQKRMDSKTRRGQLKALRSRVDH